YPDSSAMNIHFGNLQMAKERVLILCTGNSAGARWRKGFCATMQAISSRSKAPGPKPAPCARRLSKPCCQPRPQSRGQRCADLLLQKTIADNAGPEWRSGD